MSETARFYPRFQTQFSSTGLSLTSAFTPQNEYNSGRQGQELFGPILTPTFLSGPKMVGWRHPIAGSPRADGARPKMQVSGGAELAPRLRMTPAEANVGYTEGARQGWPKGCNQADFTG